MTNEKSLPEKRLLLIGSSPHAASPVDSRRLMANVLIALSPVTVYGVVVFGLHALAVVLTCVAAAAAGEAAFRRLTKQEVRVGDLSACVTGLLLALVLPPSTPLWQAALGAVFAVIAAKEFFGGLGANVFNPALAGRAFLLMSFPVSLTTWQKPGVDALSAATPLGALKMGTDAISGASLHFGANLSGVQSVTGVSSYGSLLKTLFFGNYAGCIGETSALCILAGFVYLAVTQTIDLRAPLAMLASALLSSLAFGMDPLVSLLSGGLLFGAVFMATDYVSAPVTERGKIVFGLGAGLITVLIRRFGNYPEGVMFSLLIMNAASPWLNKLLHKKYGVGNRKWEMGNGKKGAPPPTAGAGFPLQSSAARPISATIPSAVSGGGPQTQGARP